MSYVPPASTGALCAAAPKSFAVPDREPRELSSTLSSNLLAAKSRRPIGMRESRTGRRRLFAIMGPPHRLLREINRSPSRVKKSVENLAQDLRGRGVRRLFSSCSFSLLFAFSSCSSLHFCGCYKKQSFITALMGCGFRCIKSVAPDAIYEAKNNKKIQQIRMSRGCHVCVTRSNQAVQELD